jgi:fructose 5-dehydrogenase cytochrome subunit
MRDFIRISGAVICLMYAGSKAFAADDVQAASVMRGAYVATASDCNACHTAPGGKPFAGGLPIASPVGTIYSTNITPSAAGIRQYTEDQFARAVRAGVRADGANLYPAMPYTSYKLLTDADVHDLYTYLKHGVAPVDTVPKQTALPFPMNVRLSMKVWNLLFLGDSRNENDGTQSADWNRGKYLVDGAAHCSTCHTPRGFLMQELPGQYLRGGQVGPWFAPNITSDTDSGIGSWTKDELITYLETGAFAGRAQAAGSMAEAIEHSFSHLTVQDISAIATYIKTVPPQRAASDDQSRFVYGKPFSHLASLRGANSIRSDTNAQADGDQLFSGNCASCHQALGQGSKDKYFPSLFHNSATGSANHSDLIATILNGVDRTTPKGQAFMPGFGGKANDINALNDAQVATLANYVLEHYGRVDTAVKPSDVAQIRAGGPTSSLLLLARIGVVLGIVAGGLGVALLLVVWLRRRAART